MTANGAAPPPDGSVTSGGTGPHLATLLAGVDPEGDSGLLVRSAVARGLAVARTDDGYLHVSDGAAAFWFRNGWSTLNPMLVRRCLRQKEVTSRLLRHANVPAPDNAVFGGTDLDRAWRWAEGVLPVVVKPHAGKKGRNVHLGVDEPVAFARAFGAVADECGAVLVEQRVAGEEHRFAFVDGDVVAVARRRPMHVVGNGVATVGELVECRNDERRSRRNPVHGELTIDRDVIATLDAQGLTVDSVPDDGVTVALRGVSNVSLGGDAIDVTDDVDPGVVELVTRAAAAIPGLRCAGFDVMIDGATAVVLEVNANPMFAMHHHPWAGRPRDVYARVLDAAFAVDVSRQ